MSQSDNSAKLSFYSPCNDEAYALELANAEEFSQISDRLLAYYRGHFTQELLFRTRALKRLKSWLKANEAELLDALHMDLGITTRDAYLNELMPVYRGLRLTLENMKGWSKPKNVTRLAFPFTTKVEIHQSPLGLVTIVGSGTHPLQDCLSPMVQAVSAGNCVLLSPHEANTNTAQLFRKLCRECFDSRFVFCLPANKDIKSLALKSKVSKIFFYGNAEDGAMALHAAADSLTPVSLALDAACPCIIDSDADPNRLLRAFSRKTHCGPKDAYSAPNHFYVHESMPKEYIDRLKAILPNGMILEWKEEDRFRLSRKIEELGRIRVCYLFSRDEKLQKRLAQQLNCELLLTNDYPSIIDDEHSIIPGKRLNNVSSLQAEHGFEAFSRSKISLNKPNLLELPLRIAKNARVRLLSVLATRKAETEQK